LTVPSGAGSGDSRGEDGPLRLATAEIRWFLAGDPSADVRDWYAAACPAAIRPARRVDRYLALPSVESLGIKLREGRLELKRRVATLGRATLAGAVRGRLERWEKWSLPAPALGSDEAELLLESSASWLPVEKRRALCAFVSDSDRTARATRTMPTDRGCGVELVRLVISGAPWWSLGLESFGPEDTLEKDLEATARTIFGIDPPPLFTEERSFGYPRWLSPLASGL
jgi:hypothetical protein